MSSQKPKVYIMIHSSHDFSSAEEYGTIIYLTDKQVNRFSTTNLHRHLVARLEGSQPHDYLLLTSLTVLNVLAACIFLRKHNRLNLLIYRSKDNSYVNRTIIFD